MRLQLADVFVPIMDSFRREVDPTQRAIGSPGLINDGDVRRGMACR